MIEDVTIDAVDGVLPGLWLRPDDAIAALVLAHGAGAGMAHPFMTAVADGLGKRRIATLRFQFPFMAAGSRRPDKPTVAQAAIRAATEAASSLAPSLQLFAGGKSFGGRMTSQAQAFQALPAVRGLVFLGFPLHPAGKPSASRGTHLDDVRVPMLFVQGTRDALADHVLIAELMGRLGEAAILVPVHEADHSFHVPKRSGRTDDETMIFMLDNVADWISQELARP